MNLDSAVVYVRDIDRAVEFYRDFLGLTLDYVSAGRYAQFKFGNGVGLGIKQAVEVREIPGAQTIFIRAEKIEEIYARMKQAGANVYKELKTEKWGMEFAILDPDGNKIEFVERGC